MTVDYFLFVLMALFLLALDFCDIFVTPVTHYFFLNLVLLGAMFLMSFRSTFFVLIIFFLKRISSFYVLENSSHNSANKIGWYFYLLSDVVKVFFLCAFVCFSLFVFSFCLFFLQLLLLLFCQSFIFAF